MSKNGDHQTPPPSPEVSRMAMELASGALARASAHEVNNALTAVRGYLDLARSQLESGHQASNALAKAEEAAEAAVGVVRDFLNATRPEGGIDPEGTLSRLIQDARKMLGDLRVMPASEPSPPPEEKKSEFPCVPEVVLVAEDDTFVRSILISGLRSAGYEVHLAADPEEMVALCSRYRDPLTTLVVDLEWKGLGGLEGARKICESCSQPPMILLSATDPPELLATGLEKIHLIRKPFPMANLLDLVKQCGKDEEKERKLHDRPEDRR